MMMMKAERTLCVCMWVSRGEMRKDNEIVPTSPLSLNTSLEDPQSHLLHSSVPFGPVLIRSLFSIDTRRRAKQNSVA